MLRACILATACFLLFLILHVLIFHYARPAEKARTLVRLFIGVWMLYPAAAGLGGGPYTWPAINPGVPAWWVSDWGDFSAGCMLYGFLFLGYLEFYFTADRSITCRMLMLIENAPDRAMNPDEMRKAYDLDSVVTRRLNDMTYGGYLAADNGRYRLTSKGRRMQKLYRFVIDLLRLGPF